MAKLLIPFEQSKEVSPKNGRYFTLKELYKLIGCECIKILRYHNLDGNIMIVDEEARLKEDVLMNLEATLLYGNGFILGNAIVCNKNEIR